MRWSEGPEPQAKTRPSGATAPWRGQSAEGPDNALFAADSVRSGLFEKGQLEVVRQDDGARQLKGVIGAGRRVFEVGAGAGWQLERGSVREAR
jgi:hypothetical protein